MWGKLGLVLMKFAEKKQLVKSAAASHTGFLTTGNFHQKHCVSNFSEPPRIREFFDEKKLLHGHQYHHPGSGAARNLKIPSWRRAEAFLCEPLSDLFPRGSKGHTSVWRLRLWTFWRSFVMQDLLAGFCVYGKALAALRTVPPKSNSQVVGTPPIQESRCSLITTPRVSRARYNPRDPGAGSQFGQMRIKKSCVFLETWQLPLPKNRFPLLRFCGRFLEKPLPKSFPSPARNPPKSRTFSFSPKGLEPWGTRERIGSAHKANFQNPYAIFFLDFVVT